MSHHNPHWQTAQTDRKFIASVDVGTTSIRCFFYDENGSEVTTAMSKVFFYIFPSSYSAMSTIILFVVDSIISSPRME